MPEGAFYGQEPLWSPCFSTIADFCKRSNAFLENYFFVFRQWQIIQRFSQLFSQEIEQFKSFLEWHVLNCFPQQRVHDFYGRTNFLKTQDWRVIKTFARGIQVPRDQVFQLPPCVPRDFPRLQLLEVLVVIPRTTGCQVRFSKILL
jgi:hypothetical protein